MNKYASELDIKKSYKKTIEGIRMYLSRLQQENPRFQKLRKEII